MRFPIAIRRVVCKSCGGKDLMLFFFTSGWRCSHCWNLNYLTKVKLTRNESTVGKEVM